MPIRQMLALLVVTLAMTGGLATTAMAQTDAGALRVGAARVDITPAESDLPEQYLGILDQVYSRAIVVDNGAASVALVTVDALTLSDPVWRRLSGKIASETGIAVENQIITATGTHSMPGGMRNVENPSPPELAWEQAIIASVAQAKARLQPARMGFGSGQSYINVQRDRIDPVTRRWWEGPNYEGVSDKSVGVLTFTARNGDPIAAWYNYGVFNVITGTLDLVSSDVTGASSKYIEDEIGDGFVAALSAGTHGDQNPIFFNQTYELRDIRIRDYAARGEDIAVAMPPAGGTGLDRSNPRVAQLMDQQKRINGALGLMLGEEVLRVMRDTRPGADGPVGLYSAQTEVECPGRRRTNAGRGGMAGTYEDAEPVRIRLGLTMIGDVAIGSVNAGIYTAIGLRLKAESPFAKTMLTTRANGRSAAGYIPDDASYGHETFAVLNSPARPGCAESAIVNGIIGMMPTITYQTR